jgi:flagellar assembly protein FliH
MMNSPSEVSGLDAIGSMNLFRVPESSVSPFEFRLLTGEDAQEIQWCEGVAAYGGLSGASQGCGMGELHARPASGAAAREASLRDEVEAARQKGFEEGEQKGRCMMRADLNAEMNGATARQRELVVSAVAEFRMERDRYFEGVEQEVVKLALAIAARVLHREAHMDPLLLAGVVRVALEKMADRSNVVLRVGASDVEAWQRALLAMQPHERPRVAEDTRLECGECVLETTMGTVELGVQVQLEEIEKGFFDLLNHRPTE